jgi:radical SAM protein with 4Fe4S-binding SPASM domain
MISFDGGTRETFEAIRQGGNFALTLERLAMIRKLRNIHLSAARSIFVFNCVSLRRNAAELPRIVRIACRYGISSVGVTDYFFNYNEFDTESLRYDPDLANRSFSAARDEAARLGVAISLPPYFEAPPPPVTQASILEKIRVALSQRILPVPNRFPNRCSSPWREPYIRNNGVVSMCCLTSDAMGNLKTQPFEKIWNNWRYRILRWRIQTPLPPPTCRNCFIHWGINGGNPANVKAQEGLLIKAWYKAEQFLTDRAWPLLKRLGSRILGRRPASEPEPNYRQGRPIRKQS